MEISCTVIELLPNSTKRVQEWADFLQENRDAALLSLKQEGVTVESAFVVNIEGKDYLVGYMRSTDLCQAQAAASESKLEVDAHHQAFKNACWGKRYRGKPISDLSRIPNEEHCA